ncbi:MAG TPA: hypothetical protein VMY35_04580 [Phycisphaerae bacterium]|nr:hypothetical protein [Phycisphaerae bacterium]
MAKARKSRNPYPAAMRIWLAQKDVEIDSCNRAIRRFQREAEYYRSQVKHVLEAARLEEAQIRLARKARANGKRDLAVHLRRQDRKSKK